MAADTPPPLNPAETQAGDIINQRYRVEGLLGRGGMGNVFLVSDQLKDEIQCALKTLRIERLNSTLMELFKEEFRILTQLNHPNIARVFDFGFQWQSDNEETESTPPPGYFSESKAGNVFFTSEYIPGVDLSKASQNATLNQLLDFTVQICRALEYMAGRGIIHGDLKPSNILVFDRNIKVVDFGIAPRFFEDQIGRPCGTPKYMAPEVIRGDSVDSRADLYSLGVILYILFTGKSPFEGKNIQEIMARHLEDTPLPPRHIRKEIPVEVEKIILRLLEKEPGDRFFRANQIIEEINRFSEVHYEFETKEAQEGFILSAKFVGRARELNRLKENHQNLFAKKSGLNLCLITGDIGIGKSRLIKEFKNYLQINRVPVFSSDLMGNENEAFSPFKGVIKQVAGLCSKDVLEAYQPFINKIFPDLLSSNKPPQMLSPPDNQTSLGKESIPIYQKIAEFFIQAAAQLSDRESSGLALVFENIEKFSRESSELFHYLFHHLNQTNRSIPLLIIASLSETLLSKNEIPEYGETFNSETTINIIETPAQITYSSPNSLFQNLKENTKVHHISLTPISLRDVQDLIRSTTGGDLGGPAFAKQILEASRGNPLFISQILKTLLEQGKISQGTDIRPELRQIDLSDLKIPKSVEEIILYRISDLSPDENAVLSILSAYRIPITVRQMIHIIPKDLPTYSNLNAEHLFRILNQLKSKDIIGLELEDGEVVYSFSQEFFRKTAYEHIPSDTKKIIHVTIAQYLESDRTHYHQNLESIAQHYIAAGDIQKAFEHSLQAASKCVEMNAFQSSIEFYESALSFFSQLKNPNPESEIFILEELSRIHKQLGQYLKAQDYLRKLQHRFLPPEKHPSQMASVLRRIGNIEDLMGQSEKALETLNEAEEIIKPINNLGEKLRINWIRGRVYIRLGQFEILYQEANEALPLTQNDQFQEERAEILYNRGVALHFRGFSEEAVQDFQESLKLFENLKLLSRSSFPIGLLGMVRYAQKQYDEAIDYYKRAYEIAKYLGDNRQIINFAFNIGLIYQSRNRLERAQEFFERAVVTAEQFNLKASSVRPLSNLGRLYSHYNHFNKSIELIQRSLKLSQGQKMTADQVFSNLYLGEIYLHLENYSLALSHFQKSHYLAEKIQIPKSPEALLGIAMTRTNLEDFEEAEKCFKQAEDQVQSHQLIDKANFNLNYAMFLYKRLKSKISNPTDFRNHQDYKESLSLLNHAKEIFESNEKTNPLIEIFHLIGQLEEAVGKYKRAEIAYQRAIRYANDFSQYIPEQYRHYFFGSKNITDLKKHLQNLPKPQKPNKPNIPVSSAVEGAINPMMTLGNMDHDQIQTLFLLIQQIPQLKVEFMSAWLEDMLSLTISLCQCHRALLILASSNSNLTVRSTVYFDRDITGSKGGTVDTRFNEEIVEMAFDLGAAIITPEEDNFSDPQDVANILQNNQIACFPIIFHSEIKGVLYLDQAQDEESFDIENQNGLQFLLETICALISETLFRFQSNSGPEPEKTLPSASFPKLKIKKASR